LFEKRLKKYFEFWLFSIAGIIHTRHQQSELLLSAGESFQNFFWQKSFVIIKYDPETIYKPMLLTVVG
jgi:hypothetical protein